MTHEKPMPEKCTNCPVLIHYAGLIATSQAKSRQYLQIGFAFLDRAADPHNAHQRLSLREQAVRVGNKSRFESENTDRLIAEEALLVRFIDKSCPGPTKKLTRYLCKIFTRTGDIWECHNLRFVHFIHDPSISPELLKANWIPPEQNTDPH